MVSTNEQLQMSVSEHDSPDQGTDPVLSVLWRCSGSVWSFALLLNWAGHNDRDWVKLTRQNTQQPHWSFLERLFHDIWSCFNFWCNQHMRCSSSMNVATDLPLCSQQSSESLFIITTDMRIKSRTMIFTILMVSWTWEHCSSNSCFAQHNVQCCQHNTSQQTHSCFVFMLTVEAENVWYVSLRNDFIDCLIMCLPFCLIGSLRTLRHHSTDHSSLNWSETCHLFTCVRTWGRVRTK